MLGIAGYALRNKVQGLRGHRSDGLETRTEKYCGFLQLPRKMS